MLPCHDFPKTSGATTEPAASLIEKLLCDENALSGATCGYLERIQGNPQVSISRLFAEQSRQIEHWVARLADMSRRPTLPAACLGVQTTATPTRTLSPLAAVRALLGRHEAIACELRPAIDCRSADDPESRLLKELLEFHETTAWMLRLLLESPERTRFS